MRIITGLLAGAALLVGSATFARVALAEPPVISGGYIFSASSNCQAIITVYKNEEGQVTAFSVHNGSLNGISGTATFTPSTGRVVISGTSVDGPLVIVRSSDNSGQDRPLEQIDISLDWPYSNTETTITINGIIYRAAFGKKAGKIVQQFNVVGREEGGGCVFVGTFTHKERSPAE